MYIFLSIIAASFVIFFAILLIAGIFARVLKTAEKHISKTESTQKSKLPSAEKPTQTKDCLSKCRKVVSRCYYSLLPYMYGYVRYITILVGRIPSHRLRNLLMRYVFCMKATSNTVIYGGCEFRSPWNIRADRCTISTYCILDGRAGIEFGQDVVLGSGVHIWTEEHDVNDPYFRVMEKNRQPVSVGNHAWICSDSTILPGVTVGEGAVIASRAVLTKDAEAFGIYAGVAAHKIAVRNSDLKYTLNGKPTWHFF